MAGATNSAHWGVEDPAAATGDDDAKRAAFLHAYAVLQRRINLLVNLNPKAPDRMATEQQLRTIGEVNSCTGALDFGATG